MAPDFAGQRVERETMMKKIVTMIGAALLTVSAVQVASAGQRDVRKSERNQPIQSQQLRESNAYYAPDRGYRDDGFGNGGYGYSNRFEALREGGAISAPAGR